MGDTLELPDGDTVEIAENGLVLPTIVDMDHGRVTTAVTVQQGRLAMREHGDADLSVATFSNGLDDRDPFASILSAVSFSADGDDVYTEINLTTAAEVRELRDALTTVLRYHGEEDGDAA